MSPELRPRSFANLVNESFLLVALVTSKMADFVYNNFWTVLNRLRLEMAIKTVLIDLSGTLHVENLATKGAVNALKR